VLLQASAESDSFFCPTCGAIVSGDDTVADQAVSALRSTDTGITVSGKLLFALPGFEVFSEIGRGGMGVVYRARQLRPSRDVAIKVLPPALAASAHALERFRNEANVAAKLVDSHILPVFEVLESHGTSMLVLPFIDGTDLRRVVHDRKARRLGTAVADPHPWAALDDRSYLERMLSLLDQLVEAVAVMHAAKVLHRDIKPSNALVDQRGNLWLSDFGLARLGHGSSMTAPGSPLGTPGYMSPEQAAGHDLDGRGDLFSLAVTIYESLTLDLPYGKAGPKPNEAPPAPPSRRQRCLSKDFDVVLLKALEVNRANRYATAAAFRDDWRRVRQGLLPTARRAGVAKRVGRAIWRSPWRAAACLSVVAAGILAVIAALPQPVTQTVRITTDPPGARVALVPLDEEPFDDTDGYPIAELALRSPRGSTTPLEFSGVAPARMSSWPR
jgi:hypothetical protein